MSRALQVLFVVALASTVFSLEVFTQIGATGANVHLIVSGSKALLVDAGAIGDVALVTKFLNDNGIGSTDLDAIYITHGHRDHFGALGGLLDAFDTTAIVATTTIKNDLLENAEEGGDTYDYDSVLTVQSSGGIFDSLGLKVVSNFAPGESHSASVLISESENLVFSGDFVFVEAHLYLGPGEDVEGIQSWRSVNLPRFEEGGNLGLDKDTVFYVGHGLATGDISDVGVNRDYITFFLETLYSCAGSTFPTLEQVATDLGNEYPDFNDFILSFLTLNTAWTDAQNAAETCGDYEYSTETVSFSSGSNSGVSSSSDGFVLSVSIGLLSLVILVLM